MIIFILKQKLIEYSIPYILCSVDTTVWSKKNVTGTIPQAQSSSSVSTQDGRIVTFGGVLMGKACNDTYILQTGKYCDLQC